MKMDLLSPRTGDDGVTHQALTVQKQSVGEDGNAVYDRQLYIDSNGDLVLNGSLKIFFERD